MIYFIRAGYSGPVKIGKADNVPERMSVLQCAHYETLTVIREMPGSFPEETWLRRRFGALLIRGEWHHYCREMLTVQVGELVPAQVSARPATLHLTASQVIDRLGGTAVVARLLDCGRPAVSNWRHSKIPSDRWAEIVYRSNGKITFDDLAAQIQPDESEAA